MIETTPAKASYPVDIFLKPSPQEQSTIAMATCSTKSDLPCSIPVRAGLFFDGTNNNLKLDRNGKRTGVIDPSTKKQTLPAPAGFDKMPIDDEVFAKLVDMSEADAVLANLYDNQPDLFRMDSPAQCHARVVRHLRVASANGIHAAPARQQFGALALLLSDDFTQHAAMSDLLRRTRQGADYNNEISALPEEFWRTTER